MTNSPEGNWYCTFEDVARALDLKWNSRSERAVGRAIESGSRSVEAKCHRYFFPWQGQYRFNWPDRKYKNSWKLWLDDRELISVDELISGDDGPIPPEGYFLEPTNDGPPYDAVEINLGDSYTFSSGSTHQQAIQITGLWGYDLRERQVTVLDGGIAADATSLLVDDGSQIGIGSLMRIDSERMRVTGRRWATSGVTLTAPLAANRAAQTVAVSDGTGFNPGETILVGFERLYINDVVDNTLNVSREWDGTTLAAHLTDADVLVSRLLLIERGVLGTSAATHSDTTVVRLHQFPALITQLAIAEAINSHYQELSGYSRVSGEGENAKEYTGRGLNELRGRCYTAHGRQARFRSV